MRPRPCPDCGYTTGHERTCRNQTERCPVFTLLSSVEWAAHLRAVVESERAVESVAFFARSGRRAW